MARRKARHVISPGDTIVINGFEVSADVLSAITDPEARLLWAFVRNGHRIQPVAYDEQKVIWLEPSDLERTVDVNNY